VVTVSVDLKRTTLRELHQAVFALTRLPPAQIQLSNRGETLVGLDAPLSSLGVQGACELRLRATLTDISVASNTKGIPGHWLPLQKWLACERQGNADGGGAGAKVLITLTDEECAVSFPYEPRSVRLIKAIAGDKVCREKWARVTIVTWARVNNLYT
jgi:hypothetical protein